MRSARLPRALSRGLLALALAMLATAGACGEDEQTKPSPKPASVRRDVPAELAAAVEAFVAAPDYAGLRALLAQGHAVAREQLGPHRLHYTATISTGPADLDPEAPLPDVTVEEPIYERFAVTDELELVWAAAPGEPPRMRLDQHNEHQHGRALILIDERAWAQLDGREWFERPLESDLWQLWADDAQHAALDLVELAGPHAEIDAIAPVDLDGRPAVRVSLRQSERRHPERTADAPTPWRRGAEVEVLGASIVLDRATGLWLRADIELGWTFDDSAGRELRGHARLEGRVELLAEPPAISPPSHATPVPERDRPELLRERLLDGLAGP